MRDERQPAGRDAATGAAKGEPAVSVVDATVRYGSTVAVDRAQLDVQRGEVHALLGPSGCGKTTLLRAVAGLEPLHAGRVSLAGRVVADGSAPHRFVPPEERRVGLVFQDYALFPHLTVGENVAFGLRAKRDEVSAHLARVGLDHLAGRYPSELSGGQQQRVALARALATEPDVLLLDEPFSGVDQRFRRDLRTRTAELLRQTGVATLFVTHDVDEAFSLGDRLSVMSEGRLLQTGTADALYHDPCDATVAFTVGDGALLIATRDARGDAATCALGPVRLRATASAEGAASASEGSVLVRPEQVRVAPAGGPGLPAEATAVDIAGRTFLGGHTELDLRLPDGTRVSSRHVGTLPPHGPVVAWVDGPVAWLP
jgi:iron(III) transport system ATP-binding protein